MAAAIDVSNDDNGDTLMETAACDCYKVRVNVWPFLLLTNIAFKIRANMKNKIVTACFISHLFQEPF